MRMTTAAALLGLAVVGMAGGAQAKGCLSGAAVGGLAGHMVGHGVAGAAAGCAIGHHEANKRNQSDRVTPQQQQQNLKSESERG